MFWTPAFAGVTLQKTFYETIQIRTTRIFFSSHPNLLEEEGEERGEMERESWFLDLLEWDEWAGGLPVI
jgi:hypothetical protein